MKFIPENNITDVSSSSQDAVYIDDWVLEDKPKKAWKGTSTSETLTLTVSAGNCIPLYNHNADTVTVTIKNLAETVTHEGPFVTDLSSHLYGNDNLWQEYSYLSAPHKIIVELSDCREDPSLCGIAWAGVMQEFTNPDSGLHLAYEYYSVKYKMSSRSIKYLEKDIKKKFSSTSLLTFDDDWLNIMQSIKNNVGYSTIPWLIMDDQFTTHNIFGYISDFSLGSHEYAEDSNLPLEIIER